MHDARVQSAAAFEAAVREYFQHLAILAENVGFEFLDPVRIRDSTAHATRQPFNPDLSSER